MKTRKDYRNDVAELKMIIADVNMIQAYSVAPTTGILWGLKGTREELVQAKDLK